MLLIRNGRTARIDWGDNNDDYSSNLSKVFIQLTNSEYRFQTVGFNGNIYDLLVAIISARKHLIWQNRRRPTNGWFSTRRKRKTMHTGGNSITWECRFPRTNNLTSLFLFCICVCDRYNNTTIISISGIMQKRIDSQSKNSQKQQFDIWFKVHNYIIVQWDQQSRKSIVYFLREALSSLFQIGAFHSMFYSKTICLLKQWKYCEWQLFLN